MTAFTPGLNRILLVAAIIALASGVVALATIRGYSLTQAPGHPVPGHWTGPDADAAIARVFQTLGNTDITVREIVADGPHRVIGLVDAHGTAQDGKAWTMPVAECFWIEGGKVTDIRPYYWTSSNSAVLPAWPQPTPAPEQAPVTAARAARC
jgi:ketosteroid isomerase-like protein